MDIDNRHGFSMVEVAAALVLMGMIAAIAAPHWSKFFPAYSLDSSTRQLQSELHSIKMRAVSENIAFQLQYGSGAAEYAIQRNAETLATKSLPEGIIITKPGTVTFFPRGTAAANRIRLRNIDGVCQQVVVSSTGRVRICKPAGCVTDC